MSSRQQQHVPHTRIRTLAGGSAMPSTPAEHVPTTCADRTQPSGEMIKKNNTHRIGSWLDVFVKSKVG